MRAEAIVSGCPEGWFGEEQPPLAGLVANMPEPAGADEDNWA